MKIGFISLGCPKNQVDTEVMIARAKACGYQIVSDQNKAEIIVVNTCGFLDSAREEAVDTLIECGELKRKGRLQYLLAVGCLPQLCGSELLEELPEVDGLAGISALHEIDSLLESVRAGQRCLQVVDPSTVELSYAPRVPVSFPGTAYLKIADGCNNACSYCLIPSIRGRYRSKPAEHVLREAQQLLNQGVKELVLIAQDSGMYGSDLGPDHQLPDLLRRLCRLDGLQWLRLMYLHPEHVSESLLDAIAAEAKIVPYLEIPIQHASRSVLRSMNRHYGPDELRRLIARIRTMIPGVALRTTVMVGFPGESAADFQQLLDFIRETEFDWLGSFIFEPQQGTAAGKLNATAVPGVEALKRQELLMDLQRGITRRKNQDRLGARETVLVERRLSTRLYAGRSRWQAPEIDGITVIKSQNRLERGQMVDVMLKGIRDYDMIGECGV